MSLLSTIELGPFQTTYHRELVNEAFLLHLERFVARELIPQVDHPVERATGSFVARFNEERNCGPNSAIRNQFRLTLSILGSGQTSDITTDLDFDPVVRTFDVCRGRSLSVWTPSRCEKRRAEQAQIQQIVEQVQNADVCVQPACPACGSPLSVIDNASLFDVVCTSGCFNYNYHKDEKGRLLHGHFFMRDPPTTARTDS